MLPLDQLVAARKKGVLFDVGHGGDGFWFRSAVPGVKQGFLPDTISTGMDSSSIMLPRTTMTNVLSKFLAMGLKLDQVVERATSAPARAIRRTDIGSLEEGGVADIAVFEVRKGHFGYLDSGHARLIADQELRCILTIRAGKVVWDTEGLSLTDWKSAGPYSNFK
jgi:dihydroorotase